MDMMHLVTSQPIDLRSIETSQEITYGDIDEVTRLKVNKVGFAEYIDYYLYLYDSPVRGNLISKILIKDDGINEQRCREIILSYGYATEADMTIKLADKQDKLIAGENITIAEDGRTISASGNVKDVLVNGVSVLDEYGIAKILMTIIPSWTSDDEGKVLGIKSGKLAWVDVPGGSFRLGYSRLGVGILGGFN